ncbi:hypothetical protein BC629DRAFT_995836 [Irpex lacteus]|nr:hypothetical protein BC629DRAFT_995836 [Irpex lacteus]
MSTSATSTAFPTPALQVALATSVANGTFSDTAYYLYSQRGRNWKIGNPQIVYANSGVMKAASQHFHKHFNDESAAGQKIDRETEDYGYDSDSDIDDSEAEERALETQGISDGEVWDDKSTRSAPSPAPAEDDNSLASEKLELAGTRYKYRVVIPDVAAKTWQALVHFIYTGTIHFAPLKSQGLELRREEENQHREKNPHLPPLCSPKSVYRLAEFVGLEELKHLAQKDLKAKITKETVAREVFSRFSSMYSDILDMQLEILYQDSMLADTLPKVLKTTTSIAQGNMPYSEKALAALLTKLSTFLSRPAGFGFAPSSDAKKDAPGVKEHNNGHPSTQQVSANTPSQPTYQTYPPTPSSETPPIGQVHVTTSTAAPQVAIAENETDTASVYPAKKKLAKRKQRNIEEAKPAPVYSTDATSSTTLPTTTSLPDPTLGTRSPWDLLGP